MTARTRSTVALLTLAVGVWAYVAHEAVAAPPDPNRPVAEVARESARSGWPHTPTQREANAITYRMSKFYFGRNTYGSIRCYNRYPDSAERWACDIRTRTYNPRTRKATKLRARTVTVDFWEDGSFILYNGRV